MRKSLLVFVVPCFSFLISCDSETTKETPQDLEVKPDVDQSITDGDTALGETDTGVGDSDAIIESDTDESSADQITETDIDEMESDSGSRCHCRTPSHQCQSR